MRSASRLRWAVIAALALMGSLYLAARLGLRIAGARVEYGPHALPGETGVIADLGMAMLFIAFIRLTQMLGAIARGQLFSPTVIRLFRGFAFWLLLMAATGLIGPILTEALTRKSGDPVRLIIDFRQILTAGVTLLLFLIARLLERARAIDEEVQEFV